jgi:hypothetical protein
LSGVRTQDLIHLEPRLSPFCFSYFSDSVLCFFLGPSETSVLLPPPPP